MKAAAVILCIAGLLCGSAYASTDEPTHKQDDETGEILFVARHLALEERVFAVYDDGSIEAFRLLRRSVRSSFRSRLEPVQYQEWTRALLTAGCYDDQSSKTPGQADESLIIEEDDLILAWPACGAWTLRQLDRRGAPDDIQRLFQSLGALLEKGGDVPKCSYFVRAWPASGGIMISDREVPAAEALREIRPANLHQWHKDLPEAIHRALGTPGLPIGMTGEEYEGLLDLADEKGLEFFIDSGDEVHTFTIMQASRDGR